MNFPTLIKGGLVLGGLALLGVGCPQQTPAPQAPASQTGTEVAIAAAGFSPATLQVTSVPATVTFRNTDTKPHWVASDPHPVHTGVPGFDVLKPIPSGGTYTFTFTSSGTFGYHDHLNPGTRGTVNVIVK